MSDQRIPATVGLRLVTLITLGAVDFNNFDISKLVRRKCPMWFVANWISMFSGLKVSSGIFIRAALLIRMSSFGMEVQERTSVAAFRTEAWEERLRIRGW